MEQNTVTLSKFGYRQSRQLTLQYNSAKTHSILMYYTVLLETEETNTSSQSLAVVNYDL